MQANAAQTIDEPMTEPTPKAATRADDRAVFAHRFEAELQRLEEIGPTLDVREGETLLSALGAALLGEYELASAFLRMARAAPSASQPARNVGRRQMPVATLRWRFEHLSGFSAPMPRAP
ncbi:MAG: hypothetical protein JSR90_14775 [Proteobacteria bacterium]|nr:hypothetical protein [Pseudomonadota bacterium]